MRMLATIAIQPHVKNKLTPEKLLPFPWEKLDKMSTRPPKQTAEEDLKRFETLAKRMKN
jgi:hypothetical protein